MIKLHEMYCFLHMEMYFHETFFAKLRYAIIIVHMSRCCRNINAKCAEHSPSDPRSTCSTLTSSTSSTGQCYVALDRHVQAAAPNTVMCICAMHSSEYDTHNNTGSGEDQLADEDTKLNYALAAFLNTTSWISSTPSWSGVGQR